MKRCSCCKEEKPLSDFYNLKGAKDGKRGVCIECEKRQLEKYRGKKSLPPASTTIAKFLLAKHGIPAISGYQGGQPWVDLLAWGFIPIEAKSSRKVRGAMFAWALSPGQRERGGFNGLYILLGIEDDAPMRIFIMPADDEFVVKLVRKSRIRLTPDTSHHNGKNWRALRQYENRWDLIEQRRLLLSEQLRTKNGL